MSSKIEVLKFLKTMTKFYTDTGDKGRSVAYGNAYQGWDSTIEDEASIEDMISMIESDEIPGFGPGTKQKVLTILDGESLPIYDEILSKLNGTYVDPSKQIKEKILPSDTVNQALGKLLSILNSVGVRYDISGNLRRGVPTSEVDILIYDKDKLDVINNIDGIKVIDKLDNRIKVDMNNVNINLRILDLEDRGCALIFFTGPDNFNLRMRKYAKSLNFRLKEYELIDSIGISHKFVNEEEVFTFLKLGYIEPKDRN